MTLPLIINKATGKKFGKSEDGAVWLDPEKTSVYKFYQFWINVDDEGVEGYMKIYTELDKQTIDDIIEAHNEARSNRLAQKHLAYEVTKIVHGEDRAKAVQKLSEVLFGGESYSKLTKDSFRELESELTTVSVELDSDLVDVLVSTKLAGSKGEARRFLQSNAIYVNGQQISLEKSTLGAEDFIDGYCVLRRGKNATALVRLQ